MDRPKVSGTFTVNDLRFDEEMRKMLECEEEVDDPDEVDDVDSEMDFSDTDPDFLTRGSEEEFNSASSDDAMENDAGESYDVINSVAVAASMLPEYFPERMRKAEQGPPNAWRRKQSRSVQIVARNSVMEGLPDITGPARTLGEACDETAVWQLIFDRDIVSKIVTNTNAKLASIREKLPPGNSKASYRNTNFEEVNALIGVLLLSFILKSKDESIESLFTRDEFSRPIFRATMSVMRYKILVASLRFDDAKTREQRNSINKASGVSEIFEKIFSNSQAIYHPSANVTVDEMLIPFRGRCAFRKHTQKSTKNCGIKVICMADAETSYLYDAYICTDGESDRVGLAENEKKLSIPTQSVIRLCKSIEGTNRNVTANNLFSSLETVEELAKRKLTFVGMLKKDDRCIPLEFLASNERPVSSTLYGFRENVTLLSFVPQKNKALCLVSSKHNTIEINKEKNKPEILCFYNSTKNGVNLVEKRCADFYSNRKTKRWPLSVFHRLLNIASINSFIVYMYCTRRTDTTRFSFIKSLATELITPHLCKRSTVKNLPRDLKEDINNILGVRVEVQCAAPDDRLQKRKTCEKCPPGSDRKTPHRCIRCSAAICGGCQRRVCVDCAVECV